MKKQWHVSKELKTKTVKELATEMFEYYKNDTKELFDFLHATGSRRDMWKDAYWSNMEIEVETRGLMRTSSDKCARNAVIYEELYEELYNLIYQSM